MVDLTAEQRQLAKIVHDYACRFLNWCYGSIASKYFISSW